MTEFKVIEGRQSSLYNHFKEYELTSCRATVSRLMGVLAIKLTWQDAVDARRRFYQIIHLDYSEYGIDEYLEFECIPGEPDYSELRSLVQEHWNHFINVLGSAAVNISAPCMLRLLESALVLAGDDVEREYDTAENVEFRSYALRRLGMMCDVLGERGITADSCSEPEAIETVSESGIGQYASINYFLMRILDRDFPAASYLSRIPLDALKSSPLASHGSQSLMRNSIKRVAERDNPRNGDRLRMYNCRMTTLAPAGYYHVTLSIWLDRGRGARDARVADIDIGSMTLLSDYEAAIQVAQSEYISVFEFDEDYMPEDDPIISGLLARADHTPCRNGLLCTIYNETNNHVEKAEFRLNDDVSGYALLSSRNELILMSPEFSKITALDDAMAFSTYSPHIRVKGRFNMENPIFHALCHTPGLSFDDLVETED